MLMSLFVPSHPCTWEEYVEKEEDDDDKEGKEEEDEYAMDVSNGNES